MSVAYLYSNLMTRSFRRRIIQEQNLRFREELQIGEDHAFIFAYTMYVKRMAQCPVSECQVVMMMMS